MAGSGRRLFYSLRPQLASEEAKPARPLQGPRVLFPAVAFCVPVRFVLFDTLKELPELFPAPKTPAGHNFPPPLRKLATL